MGQILHKKINAQFTCQRKINHFFSKVSKLYFANDWCFGIQCKFMNLFIFVTNYCTYQNILNSNIFHLFKIKTMGQNQSCYQMKRLESVNAQNLKVRDKITPLKYIKPVHYSLDECDLSVDFSDQEKKEFVNKSIHAPVDNHCQPSKPLDINIQIMRSDKKIKMSKNKIITNRQFDEDNTNQQNKQNNSQSLNPLQPVQMKKVTVRWNKFIQMKQKRFTDDYEVISEIGRGGFGSVYKVMMKNGRIFRAAKKIMKDSLKNQDHQNLLAEMGIMMSLDHPNITKLFEVYDHKNYYVMVLELCEGGELFQKIASQKIGETEAKNIVNQVLSALYYMHSKGIVHRDIKPENMLFQKKTKLIKIIDFGISTKIQSGQILSSRVGTPYYIAPQVLIKKYSQKCDIWSLGIVLYMIVFSSPPFKGTNATEVMQSVINDDISFKNFKKTHYSSSCLNFLHKILKKNPLDRLDAKHALNHEWLRNQRKSTKTMNSQSKKQAISRITQFHFKNKLQAVVHTYIVSQLLTSEQRLQLLELFHELDVNQNGVVDKNQLNFALSKRKLKKINEQKIAKIMDYVDTNCSGQIDYTQFLVAAIDFKNKFRQKHFQQAFTYFDIDNSGSITFQEVCQFLENQSQEEVQELFKLVDTNGDGVISKSEFVDLMVHRQYSEL